MLVDIDIIMRVLLKIYIPNVYKYGENDHNSRCLCKTFRNYLISSLSLLVECFEEEIQPSRDRVDAAGG